VKGVTAFTVFTVLPVHPCLPVKVSIPGALMFRKSVWILDAGNWHPYPVSSIQSWQNTEVQSIDMSAKGDVFPC